MKTKRIAATAVAAVMLIAMDAWFNANETHAAFSGTIYRSLCGSAGQPMNPLVATGVNWTVPTDNAELCKVTQTSLDPSYPQSWLLHFPAERTSSSTADVFGHALVFGGGFPVKQVCATMVTFRAGGTKQSESVEACTSGNPSNQNLTMVPAVLGKRGAILMIFRAFGGASILRADVQYRTEGTDP